MLIVTPHISLAGLPWSGIRSVARAVAECNLPDWSAELFPTQIEGRQTPIPDGRLLALISHPVRWYADFWTHRDNPLARVIHDARGEADIASFCRGAGRGLLTRSLERLLGAPATGIVAVRVEHFESDIYRATGPSSQIDDMMPALRKVQDAMAERPIPHLPDGLDEDIMSGDSRFRAIGYGADDLRCGGGQTA